RNVEDEAYAPVGRCNAGAANQAERIGELEAVALLHAEHRTAEEDPTIEHRTQEQNPRIELAERQPERDMIDPPQWRVTGVLSFVEHEVDLEQPIRRQGGVEETDDRAGRS